MPPSSTYRTREREDRIHFNTIDLTGQVIGNRLVTGRNHDYAGPIRQAMWNTICVCGRESVVAGSKLREGKSNSCGKWSCNHRWLGDEIGYHSAHDRVKGQRGSASSYPCFDCCHRGADWSYVGRKGFTGDPADYVPRCKRCHWHYDRGQRLVAV